MSSKASRPSRHLPVALYRHFGADGRLLYVGVSSNPDMRTRQHQRVAAWAAEVFSTTIRWFPNRDEAKAAEVAAIQAEMPAFNADHRAFPGPSQNDEGWRRRLLSAVQDRHLSMRAASLAAGLGPNFLVEVLTRGKDPSVSNLFAICAGAGIDAKWVLFGNHSAANVTSEGSSARAQVGAA